MATVETAKLTAKALGNPRMGASVEAGKRHILGTIIGLANGVKVKAQPNGDVIEAITGQFEGTRAGDGEKVTSGILYLPSGFHDRMASAVKEAIKGGGSVQFAIELYTENSSNAAGYQYGIRQLIETASSDPLDNLRKLVAESAPAGQAALPMPEAEKAGKGK